LGAGAVYPWKLAKNAYLDLGGRVTFQEDKKPTFALIFGFKILLN
jgi:hypothetical protein